MMTLKSRLTGHSVSVRKVKCLEPNVCNHTKSSLPADVKYIFTARAEQRQPVNTHKHNLVTMPILIVFVFLTTVLLLFFSANRFCVGDKFFLKNNMILCQMDYEEGQLNGSFETQVQ